MVIDGGCMYTIGKPGILWRRKEAESTKTCVSYFLKMWSIIKRKLSCSTMQDKGFQVLLTDQSRGHGVHCGIMTLSSLHKTWGGKDEWIPKDNLETLDFYLLNWMKTRYTKVHLKVLDITEPIFTHV